MFVSLQPNWCVLAGGSGTHLVYVCTYHQNVKLILKAVDLDKTYHNLSNLIVCD